jgi:hypothetical protein
MLYLRLFGSQNHAVSSFRRQSQTIRISDLSDHITQKISENTLLDELERKPASGLTLGRL